MTGADDGLLQWPRCVGQMPQRNRNIVIRGFRPLGWEINLGLFSKWVPPQVTSAISDVLKWSNGIPSKSWHCYVK